MEMADIYACCTLGGWAGYQIIGIRPDINKKFKIHHLPVFFVILVYAREDTLEVVISHRLPGSKWIR